jgi:predicted amidohydrolase
MFIPALVTQFPISLSISQNLAHIQQALGMARAGDLVVFPEGAISGYSHDLSFLDRLDLDELADALEHIGREAVGRKINVWAGTIYRRDGHWFNAAWGFTADGRTHIYNKINLAHHERGVLTPGDELPVFQIPTSAGDVTLGVQLCREIRYPEQWGWLARQGAQVILHLDNAIDNVRYLPVWRSHLISRAAETQRFVISANNAGPAQLCPTMIIDPSGFVQAELTSDRAGVLRAELDLAQVSDWYLDQCRTDVVAIGTA